MASPASAAPPSQIHSFALFPLLPPELRELVWKHCLPCTRIISIAFSSPSCTCIAYNTSAPPPTLLYVNRESRCVALRRYELYILQPQDFRPVMYRTSCPSHSEQPVWVDLKTDVLYFEVGPRETERLQIHRATGARQIAGAGNGDSKDKSIANLHTSLDAIVPQDKTGNDGSLQQIARIALPYDSIHLNLEGMFCGTGIHMAIAAHERLVKDLAKYLEALPCLREVLVVVYKEDEDAEEKRKRESKPLINFDFEQFLRSDFLPGRHNKSVMLWDRVRSEEVEFIDLKASERFNSNECHQMEEAVIQALGHVEAIRRLPAKGLKVVELMHKEEPGFTWVRPEEARGRRANIK